MKTNLYIQIYCNVKTKEYWFVPNGQNFFFFAVKNNNLHRKTSTSIPTIKSVI